MQVLRNCSIMKSLAVICVLFGVSFATPDATRGASSAAIIKKAADTFDSLDGPARIGLINEFVDMALEEAKYFMIENGYDPMQMPDLYEKISFRPIIITYWGDLSLTKGWLQDASSMERDGGVILDYSTDRILTLDVPIKFRNFLFDYRYKIRLMGLGPKGGLDGSARNIRIAFTLAIDFNALRMDLKKFDIIKIGDIDLKFNGNILTDWLLNLVTEVVLTLFNGLIKWICEIIVKGILEDIVDIVNGILSVLVPDPQIVQPLLTYQYIIK